MSPEKRVIELGNQYLPPQIRIMGGSSLYTTPISAFIIVRTMYMLLSIGLVLVTYIPPRPMCRFSKDTPEMRTPFLFPKTVLAS